MPHTPLEHPTEELLERYLLRQSEGEELEGIETHILLCDACITRLERLELEIAVTRQALRELKSERMVKAQKSRSIRSWLTFPNVTATGAFAALTVGAVVLAPTVLQKSHSIAEIGLTASRGAEMSIVPEGRPLQIHLNANDLPSGAVMVNVVDEAGQNVWEGRTNIAESKADVSMPSINQAGAHFLRLYSRPSGAREGDLLREFAFLVK